MSLNIVDIPAPPRRVPRDGYDRPMVIPKVGGKAVAHRRTTTFIDVLEDKSSITNWKVRGTLVAAAKFTEVSAAASKLDPEDKGDKQTLDRLAERLFDMGGFNWKREKGTYLHGLSELVDEGKQLPPSISADDLEDMAAYMMASVDLNPVHSEELIVCNELETAGTPDRVSQYDGFTPDKKLVAGTLITDLKTGNIEYGKLKIAAQLAVYSRGELYDHSVFPEVDTSDKKAWAAWKKTEWDPELAASAYSPLPNVNQDWGIVINLRPGSAEATLHWVDLNIGWEAAKLAKTIHEIRTLGSKALIGFDKV